MTNGSPLELGDSERFGAEAKFRETGNIEYAVLALGSWPDNPPQWALEACESYFRSNIGDEKFAAFLIGMSPDQPPTEAMQTCREYAERVERSHRSPLRLPEPGAPGHDDGILLDQMADWMLETRLRPLSQDEQVTQESAEETVARQERRANVHAAARAVTGESFDSPNVRRLERKWKREIMDARRREDAWREEVNPGPEGPDFDDTSPRMERAMVRWCKSSGRHLTWDETST